MRYLFVIPNCESLRFVVIPGIPRLMGILENIGVETECINIDAEYFRNLKSGDVRDYYFLLKEFYKNNEYIKYPECFHNYFQRHKETYKNQFLYLIMNLKNFELYKNIMAFSRYKYNYILYNYAYQLLLYSKNISAMYYFYKLSNINDILLLFNSPLNNFRDFYSKQADKILLKEPDIVGVQISEESSVIPGLYLCYLIKQRNPNIHINIGGNFYEEYYKDIKNLKDFFGVFFDSISIGDSNITVEELVKYINKEIPIEQIENLLYLKDDELKYKKREIRKNINTLPYQSFKGYNREYYYMPEFVLPVRASTTYNCYWGKCIYCNCSGEENHSSIMSPQRFVDEIEFLSKEYNTRYFAFWDNSIHPKYIDKVCDLILERKLDIRYSFYARLEKEFDYKLLKKIKKSGCIAIHWGLDSCSEKILKYINKGIDLSNARKILGDSRRAGIYNFVYIIMGYPNETVDDLQENLRFFKEESKNVHYVCCIQEVVFSVNSIMTNNKEVYEKLVNKNKEYKEIIDKFIIAIRNQVGVVVINCYWQYLYIINKGWVRYSILRFLMLYYANSKENIMKSLLELYNRFLVHKTSLELSRIKGRVSDQEVKNI